MISSSTDPEKRYDTDPPFAGGPPGTPPPTRMTQQTSRALRTILDVTVLTLAFVLAFMLRFDWVVPTHETDRWPITLPVVVALQYAALAAFAVPRFAWRYVGLREVTQIFYALAVATALLIVLRVAAPYAIRVAPAARFALIPMGVILIDFMLATCSVAGVRMLRRVAAERAGKIVHRNRGAESGVPTLLVGAGSAGVLVAREIVSRPDLGIEPVGFVDDDVTKIGTVVHGLPVLGPSADLRAICEATGAAQALITIAGGPGKTIRKIVMLCEEADIPVKIIPGIHEIVGGRVNLSSVRNVAIDDLLRRDPVSLDEQAISAAVRGRVVLVTGAGGSIGAELCRQVCQFQPERLVLVERAENNLFQIHRELSERCPGVLVVPVIADVCDTARMTAVFKEHGPAMVFHAAAHKHVPMMEWNPGEAIKNNVLGTRKLAELADRFGVSEFVMISTDKAVNPTSIMGASKRVAEIYIQALSQRSRTRFLTVRFGNVLGSAGSVVPIFQEQIARGGPVTVTHPEMKRYFMTIPEASQLVLQAATMGKGGEIFILDMGEPVKIVDLAHDLITLSGLKPDEDIEIQFTGIRPGEKLFEELSVEDEEADKTRHPKIFIGRLAPRAWDEVAARIEALADLAEGGDRSAIKRQLRALVPELEADAPALPSPGPEPERARPSSGGLALGCAALPAPSSR